jgi:hypothetical protein
VLFLNSRDIITKLHVHEGHRKVTAASKNEGNSTEETMAQFATKLALETDSCWLLF